MMGDRLVRQESLSYEFRFDDFVASDHILRAYDARSIDLSIFLIGVGISGHSTVRWADLRLIPSR
jgi:hypothetical protein